MAETDSDAPLTGDRSDSTIAPGDPLMSPETARKWLDTIQRYDRSYYSWKERVRKIHKIYADERGEGDSTATLANRRKFNLYWANIQVLQPAVYAKLPTPSVVRRWKDDDRVARVAGEMIERAVSYMWECQDFHLTMLNVRDDFLHAGRGQVWIRYQPEIEQTPQGESLENEYVPIDYVPWSDFGHNVARTWPEVTAVWRKVYLTAAEGKARFKDRWKNVSLDHKPDGDERNMDPNVVREDKATVYEIWDKTTEKVFFVAKACPDGPLEVTEPYLDFEGFFPCPRPAYGTLKAQTLIPVPDYVLYQDQLQEIDDLTLRMGKLLDALKLVGFYPSASGEISAAIEKALKPGVENQMIPVPTWGDFKEGGGAGGQIEWLPVEQVAKVLQACWEARKQLIEDVYQITGISDIVRGESEASETATAQRIKSQWGSIRIRDRQSELARFARDVARLVAEVISDKFQPETLMAMTNMRLPTAEELQRQMVLAQVAAAGSAPPAVAQGGPAGAIAPPLPQPAGPPPSPMG